MNKEEILQRSRAEKKDEGEIHAQRAGQSWGFIAMSAMYFAVTLATVLCGERVNTLAPFHAIYFTGIGMQFIGYAKTNAQKVFFVFGTVLILSGIGFFILYILDLLA